MIRRIIVTLVAALATVASGIAWERAVPRPEQSAVPAPPRGAAAPGQVPAPPAASASGVIAGVVTSAVSGRPIRGATVTLIGSVANRRIQTDARGAFQFTDLPPGRFTIEAARDGYLATRYGQKAPGGRGAPIELVEGQRVDIEVRLSRGSAITGIVFDEIGEPLIGAEVRLLRQITNQNGVRRLRVVGTVVSDDRGVYRFFNLEPAEYFVSAKPAVAYETAPLSEMAFQIASDLTDFIAGNGGGPGGFSMGFGMEVEMPVRDGAASGDVEDGYAPTYYPMSPTAARSVPVTVDGVTERAGVDINVLPTRPGTIRGTIIGVPSPGTPVQVLLHNTDPAEEPTSLTATAGPDGSFALGPVPPGQYTVFAQTLPSETDGRPVVLPLVRSASFDRRHGRTSLTVEGGDPDPIAIVLRPGRSISGRVVLDLPPAARATGQRAPITISIVPAPQPAGWPAFNTSPQVQVDDEGRFTLPGIRPGRYFLRASGPGNVRSVMWNGIDTLDVPLEVTADDDVGDVVITLTDRSSSLSGLVTDRTGKPAYDCTVIVVSTDARFWFPGSRRVAIAEPSPDGRYVLSGLPAGEYRAAAVAELDPARRFDPLFLQQLAATSVTITITDNGRHTQALRLD